MTEEDLERIKASQRRAVLGTSDAIDAWVLKRANVAGAVRKADNASLDISQEARVAYLNEWFAENFDAAMKGQWVDSIGEAIGEATAELRADYTKRLHQLELTVARLEGELKGLREDRRSNNVVDVPRAVWKHNAA